MADKLTDKILELASEANIDFERKKKTDNLIYEHDLKLQFAFNAPEIPYLLYLLSHPLSNTHYLTKDGIGAYRINENGIKYCQRKYRESDIEMPVLKSENSVVLNSMGDERPLWHVILVIIATLVAITVITVPIILFLFGN